ncbi:MAG: cob(I)yrinic acid a,c-diamide adenosyltransferase [Anaerolineae bacterium]
MKIYTKTGDRGETSLPSGQRVSKDSARVEAYGVIDELNATLGLARNFVEDDQVGEIVESIQNELFTLGADLATPWDDDRTKAAEFVPRLLPEHVERLEKIIDEIQEEVDLPVTFVLPGGTRAAAYLHLARTICRRAERRVVTVGQQERINDQIIIYLSRLSDLLFALALLTNHRAGTTETLWER